MTSNTAWFALGFRTKGEYVAHLRHKGITWKEIAAMIPGGTVSNCHSAYRAYCKQDRPYLNRPRGLND